VGSFFRVFSFMGQVLGMVRQNPMLLAPLAINVLAATPLHILFIVALVLSPAEYAGLIQIPLMAFGCFCLYFIDYFSAGLNTSMVADQVTSGTASIGTAFSRTLKASIGITIFAAVCALFDLLEQVANNQRGILRTILFGILRTIWTTATYVMMPAMVLENLGFFDSFKRSKQLMENDPTQVGIGVVGLGLVTWVISFGCFMVGNFLNVQLSNLVHPVAGLVVSLFLVNFSWAVGAYLKSTYYTCYYLWARECERNNQASTQFAPAPLRNILGDVQPGQGVW
jgi:hypothetical protein